MTKPSPVTLASLRAWAKRKGFIRLYLSPFYPRLALRDLCLHLSHEQVVDLLYEASRRIRSTEAILGLHRIAISALPDKGK